MENYNCLWETKESPNVADPGRNYYIFPEKNKNDVKAVCANVGLDTKKLPFTYIYSDKQGLSGGIHGNNTWYNHQTLSGALNEWLENHSISHENGEFDL